MKRWVFLFFPLTLFISLTHLLAKETQPISQRHDLKQFVNQPLQWRQHQIETHEKEMSFGLLSIVAGVLCFGAASISSAGGVGGGGLFIPILNIVGGLELKTATTFSAFMVTGGSLANVMCTFYIKNQIDYDIALVSQPCMLLGVTVGVVCNVMFPEWLITMLFAAFLACSTYKTCMVGFSYWRIESDGLQQNGLGRKEIGDVSDIKEPLLGGRREGSLGIPVKKLGILVIIWLSFFVVNVLRGGNDGQSVLQIEHCGTGYWLISSFQIPLAIMFTTWILYQKESSLSQNPNHQEIKERTGTESRPKILFPLMALLSGILGGFFGIGGGMLINPFLLHIGIQPQITATTSSFIVFFSSTMSSVQYLLLGMKRVNDALVFAFFCFLASFIGLVISQKAIKRYGRASLIVFSVSTVMAMSIVLITIFGAMDVWRHYTSGQYMGFRLPC